MAKWIATRDFSEWKEGDEVPAYKAEVISRMFLEPHVELVSSGKAKKEVEKKVVEEESNSFRDELLQLDGVGEKTADEILEFASSWEEFAEKASQFDDPVEEVPLMNRLVKKLLDMID